MNTVSFLTAENVLDLAGNPKITLRLAFFTTEFLCQTQQKILKTYYLKCFLLFCCKVFTI